MNDLDDELHEMFRRREGDVRAPTSTPERLVARTRRREWLTVSIGAAVAVGVTVVSLAGLRSIGSSDSSQPGDVGPTTTKTVSGITITYPERWFAEDPVAIGIEPSGPPRTLPTLVLSLTRDDPGIEGVLGCPGLANVPAGQLLMTVQEMPLALSGEASQQWPIPLQTMDVGTSEPGGCYGGWTFMRASWTASGRSFEGRVGFSADASAADRTALMDAYASMTFAPGSASTRDEVELATGVTESGATWSLTASRTGDPCWTLEIETGNSGTGTGGCADGQGSDTPRLMPVHVDPATTVFVGMVPGDLDLVVEIDIPERAGGPLRIDGASLIVPPSDAWGNVRLMVFDAPGSSGTGTVRFLDANGSELYPPRAISWDASGGLSQPMTDVPNGRQLSWQILGGHVSTNERFADVNWTLEVLYYLDGVRLTVGDSPENLGVLRLGQPLVRPFGGDGSDALVLVLTDTAVDRVSVASEGTWEGRWMPASTGAGGEARLWVVEVPGAGTGDLLLNGQISGEVRWP